MKSYDANPNTLTPEARIDAVIESERDLARLHARQLRLIAAIADDPCADAVAPALDKQYFTEELRAALGESAIGVGNRIALAQELTSRLTDTLTALESGTITLRHARSLADAVMLLEDAPALKVEEAVLPFAPGRDLSAFGRKIRREVLKCDRRTMEEQVAAALADRRVWSRPVYPCLSLFSALLPADGAQLLTTALDVLIDRNRADDVRTKDQQRADALVQLAVDAVNGYATCPTCVTRNDTSERSTPRSTLQTTLPRWQGARPSIQVTVALSTLLGLDTQPGELAGYGPVPAELAVRMASQDGATWRRLVTDELGQLVDYGRTTYRPPADLRDYVLARDRTCQFPTCNRRACRCEIDHLQPWEDGGHTNRENLIALCCRHHHGKHDTDWHPQRLPDGAIQWTSPTGHTYTVAPSTYPIDTTHKTYIRNDTTGHDDTDPIDTASDLYTPDDNTEHDNTGHPTQQEDPHPASEPAGVDDDSPPF